jgi:hypothetical protein
MNSYSSKGPLEAQLEPVIDLLSGVLWILWQCVRLPLLLLLAILEPMVSFVLGFAGAGWGSDIDLLVVDRRATFPFLVDAQCVARLSARHSSRTTPCSEYSPSNNPSMAAIGAKTGRSS